MGPVVFRGRNRVSSLAVHRSLVDGACKALGPDFFNSTGEIRTPNISVLSRAPLPNWATVPENTVAGFCLVIH